MILRCIGGFTAMVDRIQCKENPIGLATLNRILVAIVEIRNLLDVEFLVTLTPSLQEGNQHGHDQMMHSLFLLHLMTLYNYMMVTEQV
jgi:hypothetical protein